MEIDVRGLNCPEPALRLKKIVDSGHKNIRITCDCGSAEENIYRLATNNNFKIKKDKNSDYVVYTLEK